MEDPYSKRELDEKLKNLGTLICEKHDDVMVKINQIALQTTKINGYVASLKMWRAYITGAVVVIGFFVAMVGIPVIAAYIQSGKL